MSPLNGKAAIVTGASRGIGRATAERLVLDSASVVVNYASSASEAALVVENIRATRGIAMAIQADIANLADIRTLFIKDRGETAPCRYSGGERQVFMLQTGGNSAEHCR